MQVQVQRRAETLEEGDRAALLCPHAPVAPDPPPQLGEQRPHERAKHFARERAIVGAAVTKGVRQSEYPLTNGHGGENAVDEMRRGISHPATAARGAEAAALTRERHETIVTAVVAAQAQKTVSEDPAAQEGAQLLFDEVRRRAFTGSRPGEERLEPLADDPVQEGFLGRARYPSVVGLIAGRPCC